MNIYTLMRVLFLFFIVISSTQFSFAQKKLTSEEYINNYYTLAVEEMNLYKVPASITLAQGLIETESGNSLLATKANNHFGIKCKAEWTGATFIKDDDKKNECFRAYNTVEESFRDHSLFLLKPRYSDLFAYDMTDYRAWAYGLKKAGYATNPNYPAMLIKYIEDFKLFQFDNYGLEKPAASLPKPVENTKPQLSSEELIRLRKELANNLELVIVDESFDIYKVATNAKQSIGSLMENNDLEGEQTMRLGQNFFLQKKGKMNVKDKHLVLLGESLYDISQMYGVSLKLLRKYNKLETWEQPNVGETIHLSRLRDDFIKTRPFYQVNKERLEKNLELFIPIKIPEEKTILRQDTLTSISAKEIANTEVLDAIKVTPEIKQPDLTIIKLDTPATIVSETPHPIQAKPTENNSSVQNKVWINHQVKPKETIFRISKNYDCSPKDILNWNALAIEQGLKIGQILRIQTMHPNGLLLDINPAKEEIKAESSITNKPKTPLNKIPVRKTIDSSKIISTPKVSTNKSPLNLSKAPSPSGQSANTIEVNKIKPEANNVSNKTEPPITIIQKQAPVVKPAISETPKEIPREPQKPRVVILRAPTNNPSPSNTDQGKSNMSDLYKSLIKNVESDTSVKRVIKVSE